MLTTIAKAGDVLGLFTAAQPEWGVRDIAAELSVPKSNVYNLVASLTEIGLLHRTVQSRYRLGWRLLVLTNHLAASAGVSRAGRQVIRELAQRTGENVLLCVFDGSETVVIDGACGRFGDERANSVGDTLSCHAAAPGMLLLAYRQESWSRAFTPERLVEMTSETITSREQLIARLGAIRRTGVATEQNEHRYGCSTMASPIRDVDGHIVAALAIEAKTGRFLTRQQAYLRELAAAAKLITNNMTVMNLEVTDV